MGSPVASPDDLRVYLGLDAIDSTRAALILQLAQGLCEAIVNPLPGGSAAVVLDVARRAFVNPDGVQDVALGSGRVQYATGGQSAISGLYLSAANKGNLRLLAGGGGAFSIDPLPKGTNAVQTIVLTGTVTGGTFTLALGQVSAPIAWNADAPTIQAALTSMGIIGAGNVVVTGDTAGPFVATFVNTLAATPVPTMVADSTHLTGTSPAVNVISTVTGVYAAGQGLAPWDNDYYRGRTNPYLAGGAF